MYIDIHHERMNCIYFVDGRMRNLEQRINQLRIKAHNNNHTAGRVLSVFYRAVGYASHCSSNQLINLACSSSNSKESVLYPKYFEYTDPYTKENGVKCKFALVKKLFFKNNNQYEKLPVFELRVSNIKHLNFVCRCVFFYTMHKMYKTHIYYHWQCYTDPLSKIVINKNHRRSGTMVTNMYGLSTCKIYKDIRSGSKAYDKEFSISNSI